MELRCGNRIISREVKFCNGFSKVKGLMFSRKLEEDKCLVLNNASDIHMFFVFQSIDVVWLKNNQVVDKRESVRPFSYLVKSKRKADSVVELPLGKAKLFNIGDKINLR
tara:strand:+ start:768 stop:1094 length:327 start_codon:yes stop_codon:yes gene_type:complete